MHVIWHYDPCRESVPLTVVIKKGILHYGRHTGLLQGRGTVALVQISFDAAAQRGIIILRQLSSPTLHDRLRQPILQPKSNKLRHLAALKVRQIAATAPPRRPQIFRKYAPRSNHSPLRRERGHPCPHSVRKHAYCPPLHPYLELKR